MTRETHKPPPIGLQRIVAPAQDVVVNRSQRRQISGIAFIAQKCRLVLDMPDAAGNESFRCQIADVSDGGFGVVCRAAESDPDAFKAGARMTLEASDGKRSRVEIRWVKKDRLGIRYCAALPPSR